MKNNSSTFLVSNKYFRSGLNSLNSGIVEFSLEDLLYDDTPF